MLFVLLLVAVEPEVLPLVAPDVLPDVDGEVAVPAEPVVLPVPLVVPLPDAPIAPVPDDVLPLEPAGDATDDEDGEVVVEEVEGDVALALLSVDSEPLAPADAPDWVPSVLLLEAACAYAPPATADASRIASSLLIGFSC
jgi:hypothetical protein